MPAKPQRKIPNRPSPARRRPPKRSKPRFGILFLALSLPMLAFLGYYAWVFFTSGKADVAPVSVKPAVADREINLSDALVKSGIDRARIHDEDGVLIVESFDPAKKVAARLDEKLGSDHRVSVEGDEIEVASGDTVRQIKVISLIRNSDADLEQAPPGEDEQPAAAPKNTATPAPPPARVASRRFSGKNIVLILDDVGFDRQPIDEAASIDAKLNFAVIPGTPNAVESANMLNARGFEILCHLPMEPLAYPKKRPGERAIFTSMSSEEIRLRTAEEVRSIPHVRGVNNHMGSRATMDRRVMREVLTAVRDSSKYFIDSKTSGRSIAEEVAREMGVPTAGRDVFLDDIESDAAVRRQLATLARLAERDGLAVGIGHVYPVTVRVLREEIPKLRARGFRFLFASEVVN